MELENLKSELKSQVDTGLKFARSLDSEAQFEIFLYFMNRSNLKILEGIVEANDGLISGNAVKVARKTSDNKFRVSFTSSSGSDIERIKKNIQECYSTNRSLTVEDRRFQSFCYPKNEGKEGILSDELLAINTSDLVPYSQLIIKDAKAVDERIKTVGTSMILETGGFAIGNTNGVLNASRLTEFTCEIELQATEGDDRKDTYKSVHSRKMIPELEGLGAETARHAIQLLGGKRLNETMSIPTIWDNEAAACYIRASLGQSSSGLYVVEGLSPLADKIGDRIANPAFTLTDDGQLPSASTTHSCDAEGYPQGTHTLVENGVLKTFLFNSYYSSIFGTDPTGNCSRRGAGIFPSSLPYEQVPSIDISTLRVKPGSKNKTEDDLISDIDGRALFVRSMPMGIFHSQVSTGEFSAVASEVFLVENGEIITPLKSASIAGNFYTGLEKIIEIGGNVQWTPFGVETPSLIIDGLSIVA
jgi:PmbA protein